MTLVEKGDGHPWWIPGDDLHKLRNLQQEDEQSSCVFASATLATCMPAHLRERGAVRAAERFDEKPA